MSGTVIYTNGDQVYMSESPEAKPLPEEMPALQQAPPAEPELEVSGHDPIDDTLAP